MELITWISKKQPTIESSVFGGEFLAIKIIMEALRGLRYKLWIMGMPLTGIYYIHGDNMSGICNTHGSDSTKK